MLTCNTLAEFAGKRKKRPKSAHWRKLGECATKSLRYGGKSVFWGEVLVFTRTFPPIGLRRCDLILISAKRKSDFPSGLLTTTSGGRRKMPRVRLEDLILPTTCSLCLTKLSGCASLPLLPAREKEKRAAALREQKMKQGQQAYEQWCRKVKPERRYSMHGGRSNLPAHLPSDPVEASCQAVCATAAMAWRP